MPEVVCLLGIRENRMGSFGTRPLGNGENRISPHGEAAEGVGGMEALPVGDPGP